MQVKICGIRRLEDALLAIRLGADALGLLVGQRHQSPDFITGTLAREITGRMPPSVEAVLVSHVVEVDELEEILRQTGITTIQLHSEITPASVAKLRARIKGLRIFKSVHVNSVESVRYPEPFKGIVNGFVLDTLNAATDQVGGTGKTHDWSISRRIVERFSDVPVLLAGGLNPENVRAAIELVRPFGVDVNSGTKGVDGFKDATRMRDFIREAKLSSRVRAGAKAYLLKDAPMEDLLDAIRKVHASETFIPPALGAELASRMSEEALTGREIDVLRLLVRGRSDKEIGTDLFISETTVKTHVQNIFSKLNVMSRTEAIAAANQRGLIQL